MIITKTWVYQYTKGQTLLRAITIGWTLSFSITFIAQACVSKGEQQWYIILYTVYNLRMKEFKFKTLWIAHSL